MCEVGAGAVAVGVYRRCIVEVSEGLESVSILIGIYNSHDCYNHFYI